MRKYGTMFILVLLMPVSIIAVSCRKNNHFELSRFIRPAVCGSCHDEIYKQWLGSMHSLSHKDTLYREVAWHDVTGLTDPDEINEAEQCVQCHTPVGYLTGLLTKTSDYQKKIPPIAEEGIQCDYCHSVIGAGKIYNSSYKLDPGHGEEDPGTKRGPFGDARTDYHKTAYSKFHTRAEFCGACHDVRHHVFGTVLESPYQEWKQGPYAEKGVVCQDCHMYQRPGVPATGSTERPINPGYAALGGPMRKHIFTHYFTGGNSLIPSLSGNRVQKKLAEERLQNAATVALDGIPEKFSVRVTIKNIGAGHSIPTGLTHVRQMWIEVRVYSRNGATLLHSGRLDGNGYLDPSAVIFNTVFGDGKGRPVRNIAKAREVLRDSRIAPMKSAVITYRVPGAAGKSLIVEVKLWYRLVSQEAADAVLGKGKLAFPKVLMASGKKILQL
jgi:hypothetical protein